MREAARYPYEKRVETDLVDKQSDGKGHGIEIRRDVVNQNEGQ